MAALLPALVSLAAVLTLFVQVWRMSVAQEDAGIVDLFWAGGFVLVAFVEASVAGRPLSVAGWVMLVLVTLWALRLSLHLYRRHHQAEAEDARYAAMRAEGGPNWPQQSLTKVFLIQALALWAVATPIHAALWPMSHRPEIGPLALVGLVLFLAGFAIEAMADAQLARFRADGANRGRLLTQGLFRLCRHPNYLGEILVWWGLGLFAAAATDRIWALIGPALLTFFIIKVSGVPPLEAILSKRAGYADWAERTPALLPRLTRRPEGL